MPKIKIPEHAQIQLNPNSDETGTPVEFVRHFLNAGLLALPAWGESMPTLFMAMELRGIFKGRGPGDVVDVPSVHLDKMQKVLEANPLAGFNVPLIVQCGAYIDAVMKPLEK